MATVAQLHARRDGVRIAYLFLTEGFDVGWVMGWHCDVDALVGSGVSSWIGTTYGPRTLKPGLTLRDPIPMGEVDTETGLLRDALTQVVLQDDESDYLAAMFRSQWSSTELTRIGTAVRPTDDPAPELVAKYGNGGALDTTLWGMHIGNERIGPAGERRYFYITPGQSAGDTPAGMDHPCSGDASETTIPAVYISENPYQFAGRRCAIYRLVYDDDSGTWPSWEDQYAGGSLLWYGTLLDRAEYQGEKAYRLRVAGGASWTRKTLGLHMSTKVYRPLPSPLLSQEVGADETWVGVKFMREASTGPGDVTDYIFNFHEDNRLDPTDPSTWPARIAEIINCAVRDADSNEFGQNILAATNGGTGLFSAYQTDAGGEDPPAGVSADPNAFHSIRIRTEELFTPDPAYRGVVRIWLHGKVWARLGWDVLAPDIVSKRPPGTPPVSWFRQVDHWHAPEGGPQAMKGEGYFEGVFTTEGPDNFTTFTLNGSPGWSNAGNTRTWKAQGGQGEAIELVWLAKEAKQILWLGYDFEWIEGQNARPPATGYDHMGWFVFHGRVRVVGKAPGLDAAEDFDEEVEHFEVARCSWNFDAATGIEQDASSRTVIYLEAWEDKRLFGFPGEIFHVHAPGSPAHGQAFSPWVLAAGALEVRQLAVLPGYVPHAMEQAYSFLTRTICGSGTGAAWAAGVPGAAGDNQPANAQIWDGDHEFADFGLGIEVDRFDFDSFAALPWSGGLDPVSGLNRAKFSFTVPTQVQDLFQACLQNRGWALRWTRGAKGPRISAFAPFEWISPDDVDVFLTESDLAGEAGKPRTWQLDESLRWEAPVDRFKISAAIDPVSGSSNFEAECDSRDYLRRGRAGNRSKSWDGIGLPNPTVWKSGEEWIGGQWLNDWTRLHGTQVGQWMAEKHFTVVGTWAAGEKGNALMPGVLVALTDQSILSPSGAYGVEAHPGWVQAAAHHLDGTVRATIFLQARDTSALRYWGPLGEATGYDLAAETLTLMANMAGHSLGTPHVDAYGFTETGWNTALGGTASIRALQSWDHETYDVGDDVTSDVVSVSGNVVTYDAASGTLRPDTHKYLVLQAADDHAATDWPVLRYSIVTDPAGEYGGTPGYELY